MSDQEVLSSTNLSSDEYYSIGKDSSNGETENISIASNAKEESDQYSLTLAIRDIEEKLSDVLIENVKLKNMLNEKDDAVRKQFNTIVILEQEVMQICENYKKKFAEVKNLVGQLNQENKKLYAIISSSNVEESSTNCDSSDEGCNVTPRNVSKIRSEVKTEDESIEIQIAPSGFQLDSTEDLLEKIKEMATSHAQLQSKLEEVEKQREADVEQFNKQHENIQSELEVLKQKLILPEKSKLLRLINEDYKKELERKYLVKVIKLLEQKMQISQVNHGTQVGRNMHESDSQDEKCRVFIECFIEQCLQKTDLKQFQADCKSVVQTFKNTKLPCTHTKTDAICDYRKILIDEQLQRIKDERTTLNVQRQFLKVLADYNKVVTQLQMLKYENSRLSKVKESESNTQHNFAEIEKCLFEEKKICDIEREKISEERLSIEKEKQSIREEWELLSTERTVLLLEKDEIMEESRRLELEDSRLKQKTAALNNKNAERTRDAALEEPLKKKLRETTAELEGVKEELQNAHETIANLREELSKLNNQESEVTAYKLQAEMQETEFVEMREAERNYLQQIEHMSTEIHQLREENRQLVERNQNENENNEVQGNL